MSILFVCLALASAFGLFLFHAMTGGHADAPPAPPSPGPEVEQLARSVGTWDAEVTILGHTSKGVETCRMAAGGFWLVTDFEGSFMGAPYFGHGLTGFDPVKRTIVGVWVDSMGGPWTTIAGAFTKDGKRLEAEADGIGPDGQPARSRHVTEFAGNERTFRIFQAGPDGKEAEMMKIRYTRRK